MANPVHRVLFYSHDTFGLGHIRRTLALCDTVATTVEDVSVLVLSGSSSLPCLRLPPGVDYVKLPCVTKLADEHYESKFLNLEFQDLRSLREAIIFSVVANYAPDLVFVDNVPLGMKGEMRKTLAYLRECRRDTMVVLTFRDVLDEPPCVPHVACVELAVLGAVMDEQYAALRSPLRDGPSARVAVGRERIASRE